MARPSSIDRFGPEIADTIGRLLDQGRTLDEMLAVLLGMEVDVSRSALGRWAKKQAKLREKLQRSRSVTEALVRQFGDQPESKTARANIELLHSAILDGFMAEPDGDDEGGEDVGKKAPPIGSPQSAMFLARALESLTKASRHDVEFIERAEKRAADKAQKAAAASVERTAREKGLSPEVVEAMKAAVFGITPGAAPA